MPFLLLYLEKWKHTPAVRSKISSKLLFASYDVWYSDRACSWVCVLIKDIRRRLPLKLQCSLYHTRVNQLSLRGHKIQADWDNILQLLRMARWLGHAMPTEMNTTRAKKCSSHQTRPFARNHANKNKKEETTIKKKCTAPYIPVFFVCVFFLCVCFYPPADGEKWSPVRLTTRPRIFRHVVGRFNSIAFAIQLVCWRVLRFPRLR